MVCSLESLLLKTLWKFRICHRHLNLLYRRIFWVVSAFSTTLMTLSFKCVFKVGGTRDYFSGRRTWSKKNYYGRERAWLVSNRHSPALPPNAILEPRLRLHPRGRNQNGYLDLYADSVGYRNAYFRIYKHTVKESTKWLLVGIHLIDLYEALRIQA